MTTATATGATGNEALLGEAARFMPGGVNASQRRVEPHLGVTSASGGTFCDADGREYIDYHAAFGATLLGHCYPAVDSRVQTAIRRADLVGVGVTDLEIELAAKITEHMPSAERVLLCNSGTEATLHAIRLARAVTGRRYLLKFQGCYHGFHDAVLRNVLSAPEMIGRRDPGSPGILDDAIDSTLVCAYNDLGDVERTVAEHSGEVAAIILEPIPHNVGCLLPKPGFLEGLRALCDNNGIVLIFDEVVTGFRHHVGGYQAVCGVTPDLTTMGKSMGNGFPVAAVAGKRRLMDRFAAAPGGDVFFSGTYNGHPAGVSAALATIEVLESEPVHEQIYRMGDQMREGLRQIVDEAGVPAVVAGFGSVYVVYFMEDEPADYADLMANDDALFVRFRQELISRGVFEFPTPLKRSHIGYSHTEDHLDRTLAAAKPALAAALSQLTPTS